MKHVSMIVAGLLLFAVAACGKGGTNAAGDAEGLKSVMQKFIKADRAAAESLSRQLQPTEADCILVFGEENGKKVYATYAPEFEKGRMTLTVKDNQTEIRIDAATGKELREKTGNAKNFAGGYLSVASKMKEDLSYYVVRFVEPGKEHGMRFDIFAFVNGQWRVFPKPYRILGRE